MPTFFSQPIALTPEDLRAADVGVAVTGLFTDMGTGMRGAAHGPNTFRNAEVYVGYGVSTPHVMTMVDPLEMPNVVDYGNAPNHLMSTERTDIGPKSGLFTNCVQCHILFACPEMP
jgi:agmatinase